MKKIICLFIFMVLLVSCAQEETVSSNEYLDSKMYFPQTRYIFQDNIYLNESIVTLHFPDIEVEDKNYNDIPAVLKAYPLGKKKGYYVDNNPASLCNKGDIQSCSSFSLGHPTGLIRSEKYLYFQTEISTSKVAYKEVFVRTNLDGTNLEIIYTIPPSNSRSGSMEFVVDKDKVYYSFFESSIYVYDEKANKSEEILSSNKDSYIFRDFIADDGLIFWAESFKDDQTERIYKDVLVRYKDNSFTVIEENMNIFENIWINENYRFVQDEINTPLFLQYSSGEKVEVANDIRNILPSALLVSDDYVFLTYLTTSENGENTLMMFKKVENRLEKIDTITFEMDLHLNGLYKDILFLSYEYHDPDRGLFFYPMYTTISDEGFSKFTIIDESK